MRYPGIGTRIRERLEFLGFVKDGRPDVSRFCREKGYLTQSLYGWISKSIVPSYPNLMRLSKDLKTSPCWLLLGDDGTKPKRS